MKITQHADDLPVGARQDVLPNCILCRFSGGQSSAMSTIHAHLNTVTLPALLPPLKPFACPPLQTLMSPTALLHSHYSPLR